MVRGFKILVLLAFSVVACADNPVGNECIITGINDINNTSDAGVTDFGLEFSTPALDCSSRTCLFNPSEPGAANEGGSENVPLCTATCDSNDDCDKISGSPCQGGFTCTVVTTVGNFCCQKFCVCTDYLVIPEDGARATPAECEAGNDENTCCNLPGNGACGG